ncbi:Uncharacterised protein [Legionella beliardensis]|uniref:Uncharacterized protein n=1 Tax=Legionella beliardensis TaxID=91822 RepID=A0A378JPR7_9GAMM|nr:Uncharacterised protein [Legionella beliardensis]
MFSYPKVLIKNIHMDSNTERTHPILNIRHEHHIISSQNLVKSYKNINLSQHYNADYFGKFIYEE